MPTTDRRELAAGLAGGPKAGSEPERVLEWLLTALPDDGERFQRLSAEVRDWSNLRECAERHGVWALLSHPLITAPGPLPPQVREQAELQRASAQLVQMPLLATLDQALSALEAAGVPCVVLKGPLLSERLYSDASMRLSSDLDLLVSPESLDEAAAALETIGYQAETGLPAHYYRKHTHHIFLHRPHSPIIELHFRVYTGFGVVLPAEPFLSRATPHRTSRGSGAWVLAPEDEFLHLAVHAAGHSFAMLSLLYDLKLLLRRYPGLDWAVMAARAHSLGVATVLSFTSETLRRRLGVPIPEQKELPSRLGVRGRMAAFFLSASAAPGVPSRLSTLAQLLFQMLLCDRLPAAARSWRHHRLLKQHLAQVASGRT
jgi:hypothetical protein